jgi:sortase A
VAIAKDFAKPGEKGTSYIFAHSSDAPWRISSYNTVFFRLGELKEGDQIEVFYNNQTFKYDVSHSIEVWPNEVEAITKTNGNQLILQTCTPIGTSLKRLLVFASLQPKESPR